MISLQELKPYVPDSWIKAAAYSGLFSAASATVLGGTALALPALITGVATSVIDSLVTVPIRFLFVTNLENGDPSPEKMRGLDYNVGKHAIVLAITAATVVPLVGMLGTAYKVSLLGSFLMALLGNEIVRLVKFGLVDELAIDIDDQMVDISFDTRSTIEKKSQLASGYCMIPAPFLSLCAGRIIQGLALLRGH